MSLSLGSLRVSRRYCVVNFGERIEFVVLEIFPGDRVKVQNIHTLEVFWLEEITRYGKGKDFDLTEIYH